VGSKLVSMKISAAEQKKHMEGPTSLASDAPSYPYGLNISLDEAAIEKLGIDLPKVGKTLTLIAKVDVTSVSINEHTGGEEHRNVSLQITDLCLEDDDTREYKTPKDLYKDDEKA